MASSIESSLKKRALQSVKWNALSAASSVFIQFARTVILARLLEPKDYGLMGMMMIVLGFAEVFTDAGLGNAIIHKQTYDRKILSSLFWVNIISGFTVYVVLSICTPLIAWYFREPILIPLSIIVFSTLVFRSVGRQFETLLARDLHFKQIARVEMITGVLSLVVALIVAWKGWGVWALVWSHVSKVALQGVLQLVLNWNEYKPSWHLKWHDVKPYIKFSLFQLGEVNIRYLAQRFDQILLARWLGSISLGYYNFAYQLVILPVSRLNPIVTRVAFPIFAKIQNDQQKLQSYYLKMIKMLTVINAPILVAIALFSSEMIPLLFGAKWVGSIELVQMFAFVTFAQSFGSPIGALILSKGYANIGFYMNIALFALNVPSIYLGIHIAGAKGAIIGLLVVQVLLGIGVYYFVLRKLIGRCGLLFVRAWGVPFLIALISASISKFFSIFSSGILNNTIVFIFAVVVYLVVYLGGIYLVDSSYFSELKNLKKGKNEE